MQQVGYINYIGWIIQIPTFVNQETLVNTLQEIAKVMGNLLKKWNDKVKKARKEFYELNYYNTLQLLILREKLGHVRNVVTPDVLALLQNISPSITHSKVLKATKMFLISDPGVSLEVEKVAKKLSADQMSMIKNIKETNAFEEDLVLKAIEKCSIATVNAIVEEILKMEAERSDDDEASNFEEEQQRYPSGMNLVIVKQFYISKILRTE